MDRSLRQSQLGANEDTVEVLLVLEIFLTDDS